jgi:hypothetical protein
LLLLVAAAACGSNVVSDREAAAARLVEAQAGEAVTCRDNGGVNVELLPEYSAGYMCLNETGESYFAQVSPEGALTDISGPVRITPVEQ